MRVKATYTIDDKLARLSEVRSQAQDSILKEALGDYITARSASKAGINSMTLRHWRNSRIVRAKKVKSTWYYSVKDLLEAIKTS